MYEEKEGRAAKCSHYVSTSNGRVYPAMRNVPGYEDDNPADWRPATVDEIAVYKAGGQPKPTPVETAVMLDAPAAVAAPAAITLAEDDPVATDDPPQAPPGLVPAAPAFNLPS